MNYPVWLHAYYFRAGRSAYLCVALLCAFMSFFAYSEEQTVESRFDVDAADGRPACTVFSALVTLDSALGELHPALLQTGRGNQPVTLGLVKTSLAGTRQAMAHALGAWWDTDQARRTVFILDEHVLIETPKTQVYSSILINADWSESVVDTLMAPWISGDAGISYEASDGTWMATLDDAGQAMCREALVVLEGKSPPLPSLIPDRDLLDPLQRTPAIKASSWAGLVHAYMVAGISVSVAPDLMKDGPSVRLFNLDASTLESLPQQFRLIGIQAAMIHGVLCLAPLTESVEDRQLPAKRRRLVLLPLGHLTSSVMECDMVIAALKSRVTPWAWSRLGGGMWYIERNKSLLVSADVPTIHAVLRALALIDRHGLNKGLQKIDGIVP